MPRIFALTTRGLETVSAKEIADLPCTTVLQTTYRRITAHQTASLDSLLILKTVDDVFLEVATWPNIVRQRCALATIHDYATQLNLFEAAALCASVRPIGRWPSFSLTVSFVGQRNYSTEEIKHILAAEIEKSHAWSYQSRDVNADLNVRVFIEHDMAVIGVRLSKRPLQERAYKQVHLKGSLKAPVAAALLNLIDAKPSHHILDPCCGAGTILIEAASRRASVIGGDIDPAAITATSANATAAQVAMALHRWDARMLPLADASVDRVVCNLPWDLQVPLEIGFYSSVCCEISRIIAPDGKVALLTNTPHLLRIPELQCEQQIEISLHGQTPVIVLFSVD